MLNRAALILRYKKPAVTWINEADPYRNDPASTLSSVNEECTVYLLSDRDAETPATLAKWVKRNFQNVFESELEGWYVDESLWPSGRDFKMFNEWFTVECHTVIVDTVGGEICDDEV